MVFVLDRSPFEDLDDRRLMISHHVSQILDTAVIFEKESYVRHARIAPVVRCLDAILPLVDGLFHQPQCVLVHDMPLSIFGR